MSKKDKLGIDKVVSKLNKEFEATSKQFEKMVGDAFKQLDSLQAQVHEPMKKLMEDVQKISDREVSRVQKELDKRIKEFNSLQDQLKDKLGVEKKKVSATVSKAKASVTSKVKPASKAAAKKAPVKKAPVKKAVTKKAPVKKAPATKKPVAKKAPAKAAPAKKPAVKKAAPKKAAPKAPAKAAAKPSSINLTQLPGVGPATAKKLEQAGFKTFKQIAAPTAAEKKKLEAFAKTKGFADWAAKAKELA